MAETRGMTINSYTTEPKRNRNIFCHFFCQEKHVRMQLKTSYCKQMHFVKVTEPLLARSRRPGNSFSNPTIPGRFSDGINGCRLNKDVYKIIAQKPAKTPAQILWTRFLNLRSAL